MEYLTEKVDTDFDTQTPFRGYSVNNGGMMEYHFISMDENENVAIIATLCNLA